MIWALSLASMKLCPHGLTVINCETSFIITARLQSLFSGFDFMKPPRHSMILCLVGFISSRSKNNNFASSIIMKEVSNGIRSLFGKPTQKGTANHSVLYPHYYSMTLRLNAFRGEPAITRLDKLFTSNHSSSGDVALSIGSGLHSTFAELHPGHG